eukprot:3027287-Rhodomonas_salina.1
MQVVQQHVGTAAEPTALPAKHPQFGPRADHAAVRSGSRWCSRWRELGPHALLAVVQRPHVVEIRLGSRRCCRHCDSPKDIEDRAERGQPEVLSGIWSCYALDRAQNAVPCFPHHVHLPAGSSDQGLGNRSWSLGAGEHSLDLRVQGPGPRIRPQFRVQGLGSRASGVQKPGSRFQGASEEHPVEGVDVPVLPAASEHHQVAVDRLDQSTRSEEAKLPKQRVVFEIPQNELVLQTGLQN